MSKNTKIGVGVLVVAAVVFSLVATQSGLFKGKITLSPATCTGPYHVRTPDGRCVWSCGVGTQPSNPNDPNGKCVCQPNYIQTGTDSFGRSICSPAPAPTPPPEPTPVPPSPQEICEDTMGGSYEEINPAIMPGPLCKVGSVHYRWNADTGGYALLVP
jgi:hypothetical protein